MYNDLYGLFTIRWSGGTGKRNCWVVSMSFLDGGSHGAIQQIEQLIPSNSLVSYVFYILGAGFPFKTATRIKKSWPSESPLRSFGFFSTSGAYESGSLQRILKEVLESPKATRRKSKVGPSTGAMTGKEEGKTWEPHGKMGGKYWKMGEHMVSTWSI